METTYKIIGADGAEYGPVALDELKRWIVDGRVAGLTHVWRNDLSRWMPASNYAELQPELGRMTDDLSESEQEGIRPVGFWARLGAYLIDVMVLQGIFMAVWGAGPEPPPITGNLFRDLDAAMRQMLPRLPYELLIIAAYNMLLNGQFGATLGKLAIGARIVNLDGSPIGFTKAILRWLAMFASNITLGIGYLMIAFRPDKRALHDLIAGTRVVFRRRQ